MKLSEFRKLIREEVRNVLNTQKRVRTFEEFLNETSYPRDVVATAGNVMTTREGSKYKVLTTKPKEGSNDFYYDTIMKRIEQLNPEDWDVDVRTYKKAIPM